MAKKTVKKTRNWLDKIHTPHWLTALLLLIFIFRIPSFFEPFSYGDEMIYLDLGEAVRRGWVLYRDIHDNKPPLLYLTAAVAGNVFWFRVILAGWMMATTVVFWKLTLKIFPKDKKSRQVATAFFATLTTLPLLEGQTSNAELFMIGPIIIAMYMLYDLKEVKTKTIIMAGLFFSIATHYKVPAAFDMGTVVFLWILQIKRFSKKQIVNIFKKGIYFTLGFLSLLLFFFAWYTIRGAFNQYLVAAFLQNFGYLSSWRPDSVVEPFYIRNGPLIVRGIILLSGLMILYSFKNKLSKKYLFSCAWLLFALFGVTLSERPYPHYLIQIVPASSLLVAMFITDKTVEQSLTVIPLLLTIAVPVYYHFWHYPTYPYYKNFVQFTTNQKNKDEYMDYFGGNTRRNYSLAEYVISNSKREDGVFVWGDDASTIYALSRRLPPTKYVASYHINDFANPDDIINQFKSNPPSLILILPGSANFWQLDSFIQTNYIQMPDMQGTQVFRYSETISKLLQKYYQ